MKKNVTVSITKEYKLCSEKMSSFKEKIGLDLSFQSEARWDDKQKSAYISSLITGMAPSKIIIANIDSCLETSTEDSLDYLYFNKWKNEGKDGISIDGNNRTITIFEYLNNEVSIQHGEYNLPSGPVIIGDANDKFKTHPKALKEFIDGTVTISVCEYINASRSDLSDLFKNINDGVPLNPQELRNCILVPFADEIRNLVKQYAPTFKHIKKDNSRRAIDEQFVNLAVYYAYGASHGISKKDKDMAYGDNSTTWYHYNKGGKKAIEDTMRIVGKYSDAGFKDVSTLLNLFMAVTKLNKEKRKILNEEQFYKWFMAKENARVADPRDLAITKEGEKRNYAGCNKSTSDVFLEARYNYIVKDLDNISSEIVTSLDTDRLFTQTQRYQMWLQQEGKCPQTGKIIPEDEINNHELWHADHIVPYIQGGKTIVENGQLVDKGWNLKKGSKSMSELVQN